VAQAIVGLGNPGPEYRNTRHNVGQRVVDALAHRIHARFERDSGHAVAPGRWQGEPLYLIKPGSFMNVIWTSRWARCACVSRAARVATTGSAP